MKYRKIWNCEQIDSIEKEFLQSDNNFNKVAFEAILPVLRREIGILDTYYNPNRDPDESLGGWAALFLDPIKEDDQEYRELLNLYHISSFELAEINEVITRIDKEIEIVFQVYICSSDYALIILFPRCIKEELR